MLDIFIVLRVYVLSFVIFYLVVCYFDVYRFRIFGFMIFICMVYYFIYIILWKLFNIDLFVEFKYIIFYSIIVLLKMINGWIK